MTKFVLIAIASLISSHAFANEVKLDPRDVSNGYRAQVGLGYLAMDNSFTVNPCLKGKTSVSVEKKVSPDNFTTPIIETDFENNLLESDEVRIIMKAESSQQQVFRFESQGKHRDISRWEDICGTQYVKEARIGVDIVLSKIFHVRSSEMKSALVKHLTEKVTNLKDFFNLDLTGLDIVLRGGGKNWGGLAMSKELDVALGLCFVLGEGCEKTLELALQTAKNIDENYPAARVRNLVQSAPVGEEADYGQALEVTLVPYKKED